ncbi:MAG: extracellular solute-binding protein [Candidatus Hydrothermia bacterium]
MLITLFLISNLTIFHAGSLTPFIDIVGKEFEKTFNVKIVRRAGGSLYLANLIREKRGNWDLFFSADYLIIEELRGTFVDTIIPFASNEIVVAYTDKSKFSKEINSSNWMNILSRPEVRVGRSNPTLDPCGYRVLLMLEIIKTLYGEDSYAKLRKNLHDKYVRPKSAEILNLLEMGELDYAFIYLSDALYRKLNYIKLPDSLNFGNFNLFDFYGKFSISLDGKRIKGAPIIYAYAPNPASPNQDEITRFMKFFESRYELFLKESGLRPLRK